MYLNVNIRESVWKKHGNSLYNICNFPANLKFFQKYKVEKEKKRGEMTLESESSCLTHGIIILCSVMGQVVSPNNSHVEALSPSTSECDYF